MGVTADSPPRQSREILGSNLPAAAEAYLDTALVGRVHAVRDSAARNTTLDAVARIFGTRIEAEGTRGEIGRLRSRAERLIEAGRDMSTAVAVAYASDLFVFCSDGIFES